MLRRLNYGYELQVLLYARLVLSEAKSSRLRVHVPMQVLPLS